MSYLTDSSKLSGFWGARSQGLHRFWWGLRYAQPMTLLGTHLGRKDEYLAWFNTVEAPVLRHPASRWSFCQRTPSMVGPQAFHFFGVERVLSDNRGWHWRPWGENWLHNLHAFDDLVADGAENRFEWHEKLVTNWIVANAPGKGVGWRPHGLSRRIVNWIKWDLDKHGLNEVGRRNLVVQVRFLRQRLGVSMTAAYPTKAGKALLFAGAFFDDAEAAAWRKTGQSVLRTALKPSYMRARLGEAMPIALRSSRICWTCSSSTRSIRAYWAGTRWGARTTWCCRCWRWMANGAPRQPWTGPNPSSSPSRKCTRCGSTRSGWA